MIEDSFRDKLNDFISDIETRLHAESVNANIESILDKLAEMRIMLLQHEDGEDETVNQ